MATTIFRGIRDRRALRGFLSVASATAIISCGQSSATAVLPTVSVTYQLDGLDFSPYQNGQDPNLGAQISSSQMLARLQQVRGVTTRVRGFGSTNGLQYLGHAAHQLGLAAACGAWLNTDNSANQKEISGLIATALAGDCDLLIVGSETINRGDLTAAQLVGYISQAKQAVPTIPVTTADVYSTFLNNPSVLAAVDVVYANYYPFWAGSSVDDAIGLLNSWHRLLVAAAGQKSVVVSETGWPSCGSAVGSAVPSLANANTYFMNFVSWARANGVKYNYFEAFDEQWKVTAEGALGGCWGVFDATGNLKKGMQPVFDGATVSDNWSGTSIVGGAGTPTIAFTHVPALGATSDLLQGTVQSVAPASYAVAVYIRVAGGWWSKPTFATPATYIAPSGRWSCNIVTGGSDQNADEIAAYLIPIDYQPPLVSGLPVLPNVLNVVAAAQAIVTR